MSTRCHCSGFILVWRWCERPHGNLEWDKNAANAWKNIACLERIILRQSSLLSPILTTSKQWDNAVENNALAMGLDGKAKRLAFFFCGAVVCLTTKLKFGSINFTNPSRIKVLQAGGAIWVRRCILWCAASTMALRSADDCIMYGHRWAKNVYELSRQHNHKPSIYYDAIWVFGFSTLLVWCRGLEMFRAVGEAASASRTGTANVGIWFCYCSDGGFAIGKTFDRVIHRWTQHSAWSGISSARSKISHPSRCSWRPSVGYCWNYIPLRYRLMPIFIRSLWKWPHRYASNAPIEFLWWKSFADEIDNAKAFLLNVRY